MFGGPLLLMQRLGEFNAADIALAQEMVAEYKRDRERFFQQGSVVHHLEPPLYPPESLPAPLPGSSGAGFGWDSIQVVAADGQASAVFVYRAAGLSMANETHVVHPRGLQAGARYAVTFRDGHGQAALVRGQDIMTVGIAVTMMPETSEVVDLSVQGQWPV